LPSDPYRTDGASFGYVTTGPMPLIYSVSEDGKDEQASTQPTNPNVRGSDHPLARWSQRDAVVYLTRLPKPDPDKQE